MRTVHGSPYTFSVKPKWRTVVFWFFTARFSAEAYFRSSPPRGHSTVGVPKRCEGFVAIWMRVREDITTVFNSSLYRVKRGKTERGVKWNTCIQPTITKQGINRTTSYCRTLKYDLQRIHACKMFGLTAHNHRNTAQ